MYVVERVMSLAPAGATGSRPSAQLAARLSVCLCLMPCAPPTSGQVYERAPWLSPLAGPRCRVLCCLCRSLPTQQPHAMTKQSRGAWLGLGSSRAAMPCMLPQLQLRVVYRVLQYMCIPPLHLYILSSIVSLHVPSALLISSSYSVQASAELIALRAIRIVSPSKKLFAPSSLSIILAA